MAQSLKGSRRLTQYLKGSRKISRDRAVSRGAAQSLEGSRRMAQCPEGSHRVSRGRAGSRGSRRVLRGEGRVAAAQWELMEAASWAQSARSPCDGDALHDLQIIIIIIFRILKQYNN